MALFSTVLGLLALIVFILFSLIPNDTEVSYSDIKPLLAESAEGDSASKRLGLTQNEAVAKHFKGSENTKVLKGWLDSIDNKSEQQEFIDNLGEVILDAEKHSGVNVTNVINHYSRIKLAKYKEIEKNAYEKMIDSTVYFGTIFALSMFVIMMTIVIVIIRIERNTREPLSLNK